MTQDYQQWTKKALDGARLSKQEAFRILNDPTIDILQLVSAAGAVRFQYFGNEVKVHQINNIQNGLCPEDCGYCGQSKVSDAPIRKYPIKSEDEIVQEAHDAKSKGVYRYCMVSSGRGPTDRRVKQLSKVIRRINNEVGIKTCLSVGLINTEQAQQLKEAGLDRLNHNLNTSRKHTDQVVSTHTYEDRLATLKSAKEAGLDNCSGVIAGMGEVEEDLVEVAYELRALKVPSIPVNFLIPIPGNPLQHFNQLTPHYCLRILCMFRFVNPEAEIRIAGGREGHLRGLQSLALYPANSLFVEGYLSTRGHNVPQVYQMIEDAGFVIAGYHSSRTSEKPENPFSLDENPNILNPKTTNVTQYQ